jgi:DNA-binding winged helix-turn-helix (wHTH) protein/TolB-like protein/Tfp pilus assembly protein PilF
MKPENDATPRVFEFGIFRLDAAARTLSRAGEPVRLTPRVFDTLLYLVERPGTVLGKDELLAALWPEVVVEENNLGQAISKLRQALGEAPGDNKYIATVSGHGYRFVAPVTVVSAAEVVAREDLSQSPAASTVTPRAPERETRPRSLSRRVALAAMILVAAGLASLFYLRSSVEAPAGDARPRTLAVLPFKPLVSETRDEALEFGVADSLIAKLGHIDTLTVRPLTAVRRFHGSSQDPLSAGRELGVEAVLDGHIQRLNDRIRVTVRLVQISDGRQLWAGQYDEQLTSIFDIQDAISERVAQGLTLRLSPQQAQRVARRDTGNTAAYDMYLKGRFFLSLAQPRNAVEMFEQAVRLDPGFALAHAGLADSLSRLPIATDSASGEVMPRAKMIALRALELDRELGQAYAVLGWIAFYYDWDWAASEQHYLRALAIDDQDFSARLGYAHLLSNTLRPDDAIREVDLAIDIDPLSPLAGALKSQFLFYADRTREAHDQLRATLETSQAFWIAQLQLGRILLHEGPHADAVAAFTRAADTGGVWAPLALAGYAHGLSGNRDAARQILERLEDAAAPPLLQAQVHLGLGDNESALAALERAYSEKDVRMVFLGVEPMWGPLHTDRRFVALLKRMNLSR